MSVYRFGILLSSLALIGLGVAMIVVTAIHGGGVGLLIGSLFVAAGCGRLFLLRRR